MATMTLRKRILSLLAVVAVAVTGTFALAAPAHAGTGCAGGWVCLFNKPGNTNGYERGYQFSVANLNTHQWGIYNNGGYITQPGTSVGNSKTGAINNQFRIDTLRLYSETNYRGDYRTFYPRSGYWKAPAYTSNIGNGGYSGNWVDYGFVKSLRAY
ncbi:MULTISPECIES: hypothetical protein [unclassified Pseudactinotalea]|uniref:hypothetical protein n=1 Tax=unclassified Pseudactinotalea TaxID=2649176 RepID=UPI00128C1064|nr:MULTISPECIES: hypothetical protein [unclassified Pseudactinotalea]MPV49214.1 hypothetical protein [Pseudactinotalea sp. HY160]QGH68114.1 hypothetical protein GCE65_00160 [Pseudactinotalea sp. HY158]